MTTLGHCEVRITCGSREEAATIAHALVEAQLVACAHLVPISSVYEWRQVIEHDDEVLITAATRVDRFDSIVETVRSLHSYELPAVTAVALDGSHDDHQPIRSACGATPIGAQSARLSSWLGSVSEP